MSKPIGLIISPNPASCALHQTLQLTATLVHDDGSLSDCTPDAAWTTAGSGNVLAFDGAGRVKATGEGKVTVVASHETHPLKAAATVSCVPVKQDLLVVWPDGKHAYQIDESVWRVPQHRVPHVFSDSAATLIAQGVRFANLAPEQAGPSGSNKGAWLDTTSLTCYLLNIRAFGSGS